MTIGVAFSRTPAGRAALRVAAREASIHHTELVVLNVTDTAEHAEDRSATAIVEDEVSRQLAAGTAPAPDWRVVNEATLGNLADVIVDLATRVDAEFLVIGSKERSAVGKLVMGSTVRQVVMKAPMPVLVVKT
ncbi:universal stress protein [Gordonia sp. PKS22-38]|uniref:Universal stress protein n=1 Tax=Gordonia prachuapensis TaxID=3115651 RepID=A0ABU7MYE0_9ACTN|nr:universal stress protein [Gordonia sp. PKS22-38]